MKQVAAILAVVGLILGGVSCGNPEPEAVANQTVYTECLYKNWPTYLEKIKGGVVGRAEGQDDLDRMCRQVAKESK